MEIGQSFTHLGEIQEDLRGEHYTESTEFDWGLWKSWATPPEGKSWGHRGQSVGGSAVGPVGMSTMEPESSAGNRRSDLCPLPGTGVTTPLVGPHCLRSCQLIFWSFKTRVISNSLQVREA